MPAITREEGTSQVKQSLLECLFREGDLHPKRFLGKLTAILWALLPLAFFSYLERIRREFLLTKQATPIYLLDICVHKCKTGDHTGDRSGCQYVLFIIAEAGEANGAVFLFESCTE